MADSLNAQGGSEPAFFRSDTHDHTQVLVVFACRCCLSALKHNNARNAAETLACLRSNNELAKDYWKLKDALHLLDEAPSSALTGQSYKLTSFDPCLTKSTGSKAAARAKAVARELLLDQACEEARLEVAAAAVQVVDAVEQEVLRKKLRCVWQGSCWHLLLECVLPPFTWFLCAGTGLF